MKKNGILSGVISLLIIIFVVGGCSYNKKTENGNELSDYFSNAYVSLSASQALYYTYANIAQNMYENDKLSDYDYEKVKKYAKIHKTLHTSATRALQNGYIAIENGEDDSELKTIFKGSVNALKLQLPEIIEIVYEILDIELPKDIMEVL